MACDGGSKTSSQANETPSGTPRTTAQAPEQSPETAPVADTPPTSPNGAPQAPDPHANVPGMDKVKQAHGGAPELGPARDVTPSGDVQQSTLSELSVDLPAEWESRPPSSPMRTAEFVLPGPGGDAELIVYRFQGGAGGVEENIARWKGQFQAAEGKSIDETSKVEVHEVGDLKVTTVDISGHYVAAVRPGAADTLDKPDYGMLAAIVEGSGDPFFLKATGPRATLDVWTTGFTTAVKTLRRK